MVVVRDGRVVYRYVPKDRIYTRIGLAVMAAGGGVWLGLQEKSWVVAAVGMAVAGGMVVSLGLVRSMELAVSDEGLVVVWRNRFRVLGREEVFARDTIRRIRYRSEIHQLEIGERSRDEKRYFLELVTTDSKIVTLIVSKGVALPGDLGRRVAEGVGVQYEEVLQEE